VSDPFLNEFEKKSPRGEDKKDGTTKKMTRRKKTTTKKTRRRRIERTRT